MKFIRKWGKMMKKILKDAKRITTFGVIAINMTNVGVQALEAKSPNLINDDIVNKLEINNNYSNNNELLSDVNRETTTEDAITINNVIGLDDKILETTTEDALLLLSDEDYYKNPSPLVISEILPDSKNVNGGDAYEFIEVYNNSNETIDLKDYKIYYNYPDKGDSSDVIWESIPSSIKIGPQKTLIFWIKNDSNGDLTVDDFNNQFNTNLEMGKDIVEIHSGGMANGSARALKLTTNTKEVLDCVSYNMSGKEVKADKSIKYKYDMYTGQSEIISNDSDPTPGDITEDEKPISSVDLGSNQDEPILTDMSDLQFSSNEDIQFSVKAEAGDRSIKTVKLYLKDNTMSEYEEYNLTDGIDDVFTKTISSIDASNKSNYTYYFAVSDGTNNVETDEKTITNGSSSIDGLKLNLSNSQLLFGEQEIIVSSNEDDNKDLKLFVDGKDVTSEAIESLGDTPTIAFDVSQTDVFFKNAVSVGNDLIGVFDDGTYSEWATVKYSIPVKYFQKDKDIIISIHAGNKANPLEHNEENNDDFVIKNIRLIMPNGKTLRADGYKEPEKVINMGDSTGKIEILDAKFTIDNDDYTGIRYNLDTIAFSDGEHEIEASSLKATTSAQVVIDNTAPEITTNLEEKQYKGDFIVEASAYDKTTEVSEFLVTLDGEEVNMPLEVSSTSLAAGNHVLKITAIDEAGNKGEKVVNFTIPDENPNNPEVVTPGNGATILSIKVTDPTNDTMDVTFKTGYQYKLGDAEVKEDSGITQVSGGIKEADDGYPYNTYDISLPDNITDDSIVGVNWRGKANPNGKINLYAYSISKKKWQLIKDTTADENGHVSIETEIPVDKYRNGNSIKVMVQNGIGYTPIQYAPGTPADPTNNTEITTSNVEDLDRNSYDFTFALESDTQYYNEDINGDSYHHQINIHDWIIANKPRMNIQYMFHDGDIVDDVEEEYQWRNADEAYKKLDDAEFPYGVLAGNHDVGHKSGDYTEYGTYFGENRFNDNPWYGESYKNNKGHYDLISVDGIDFIMIYMGWGIGDDEIEWMNEVLAKYPERKAILNFHEYLLTSKGLGEEPKRVYDEVVSKNPNVCMVLSGHYHSAATRIDKFDDDNDGIAERTVYQMLFDYQALKDGGRGFLRLMHFSLKDKTITIRTYSTSENSYSSGEFTKEEENFVIPLDDLGIIPQEKTLSTTSMYANIYTNEVIGTVNNVASGETASITWEKENGHYGWYAEIKDSYGGIKRTPVYYLDVNNVSDNIARIEGNGKVGNTLIAKLLTVEGNEVVDSNGITYKWYRLSSSNDENGTLIGNEKNYKLVSTDRNKFIKLIINYDGKDYENIIGAITSSSTSSSSSSSNSSRKHSSDRNKLNNESKNSSDIEDTTNTSNNSNIAIEIQKNNDGTLKLIKQDGKVATGWQLIESNWYLADDKGNVKTGWQKVNNTWYYLKGTGVMAIGWQKVNNDWYYLKDTGAMATGWQKVNNYWYFLKGNGVMATGWQKVNDTWYYLKSDGAMATGWQKINNKWYYLYNDGSMASNTIINGYKISLDGFMI